MRAGLDLQQYLYNLEHILELYCNRDAHWSRFRAAWLMHMQMNGLTTLSKRQQPVQKQVRGRSSFLNANFTTKMHFVHIFG